MLPANVRMRADGRYEARYKKINKNGHACYASVYGTTPEEADKKRTEIKVALAHSKDDDTSAESRCAVKATSESVPERGRRAFPLDEVTAGIVENMLLSRTEGAALGFLACIHMGLSFNEACALRYSNFNFNNNTLTVDKMMTAKGTISPCGARKLPIAKSVRLSYNKVERDAEWYVLTDSMLPVDSTASAKYTFKKLMNSDGRLKNLNVDALQMTFIRRAVESGIGLKAISVATGIEERVIERRFKQFTVLDTNIIEFIYNRFAENENICRREMNILILGAGSHGHAVFEIIEELGLFNKISFLDDGICGQNIIGKCTEYKLFKDEYPCAFVAIGNNAIRKHYAELLRAEGYILPKIISPYSKVSKAAHIHDGCVIMPQATVVGQSEIDEFSIVASNALVDYGCTVGAFAHLDSGSILKKNAKVPDMFHVESGKIFETADSQEGKD